LAELQHDTLVPSEQALLLLPLPPLEPVAGVLDGGGAGVVDWAEGVTHEVTVVQVSVALVKATVANKAVRVEANMFEILGVDGVWKR